MTAQTHKRAQLSKAPLRLIDGDFSIELSPEQARDFDPDPAHFPAGSRVFLTHLTGKNLATQVDAAERLRDKGFTPVPHFGARNFSSGSEYAGHLEAHSRIGTATALFVGGNPLLSSGPLTEAAMLLAHPALRSSSIQHAFVGGYPEGHPAISQEVLRDALKRKLELCAQADLSASIVSQFAFDGTELGSWARRLQQQYPGTPVRIGVAGVTSLPKLIKFAVMCGIGPSLAALKRSGVGLLNVLTDKDPGEVIEGIEAAYSTPTAELNLHFFPFGGWKKTLGWIEKERSGNLA